MNNNKKEIRYTGVGDKKSRRENFLVINLPEKVADIEKRTINNVLQREGMKNHIPSDIIDIYARRENFPRLKLPGHNITLTEATNLKDDSYRRGEFQNEEQYRNAIDKFHTQ